MSQRILIVDDELYIRNIFQFNLKKSGYDVDLADDTYSAQTLIDNGKKYDLIICDLMMPVRSGMEFIKILREKYKMTEQKFMIVSAKGMQKDVLEAAHYNVSNYKLKPFSMAELVKEVDEILKKDL
jgi:DNA-binding response OmpR family regulator